MVVGGGNLPPLPSSNELLALGVNEAKWRGWTSPPPVSNEAAPLPSLAGVMS